jgi:tryptophan halogenase
MKIDNIVIVGGGSAGWMSAATFVHLFPYKKVTLIESPDVPTVGVGESTIGGIQDWLTLLGIKDTDFMEACDSTYKLSIRFENFYKNGDGGFHYPFGVPYLKGTKVGMNDWHVKKALMPETPNSEFAEEYYPLMALVNDNKFCKETIKKLPETTLHHVAFHFDAAKFAIWLRKFCEEDNFNFIQSNVVNINSDENGVTDLLLENGTTVTGDLYIDCTGFKSLLLDKTIKEPFNSFSDILPNNRAWATKVQYTDKPNQVEPFTNCTALGNGWVWNIPLWSRIGTGYVYSDKYTTPADAKQEFVDHLNSKGFDTSNLEFKDITMRIGMHERIWVKNVCAIGLSAGFIEPLESNGLYTVHRFLTHIVRALSRERVGRFEIDSFNLACKKNFREFTEFVAMHYALSVRDDTEYWRANLRRCYSETLPTFQTSLVDEFKKNAIARYNDFAMPDTFGGMNCIGAGMGYNPCDIITLRAYNPGARDYKEFLIPNNNKLSWKELAKDAPTMYEFLAKNIYKETV